MNPRMLILLIPVATLAQGQDTERALREGNARYIQRDLNGAASAYARAGADPRAMFNWGNALYRTDSARLAQEKFEQAATLAGYANAQARAYHNLGNSLLGQKKPAEAITAFKEALKRAPDDDDSRYNLAYAQKMLKQQEEQKKQQPDEKKDQEKKDQENKEQGQQDPEKKEQQQKNEQQQDQGKQQEQQKQQQQPQQIDPKNAERILDALNQQEKDVQERVRAKQRVGVRVPIEKDW